MPYDIIFAFSIGIISLILVFAFIRKFNNKTVKEVTVTESISKTSVPINKKVQPVPKEKKQDPKQQFGHKWLLTTLKGHTDNINDFDISSSSKHIISVGEDRSICLWKFKDIFSKERKIVRSSVEIDFANKVRFSPDDKACIMSLSQSNTIRVAKIKKENGKYIFEKLMDFNNSVEAEIIDIGISTGGSYIMTCHSNTTMLIWSLKGELLYNIDTGNMTNYRGMISPCGRYVVSCGFSSDTKVWAIEFDKSGSFKQVTKAFCLKGHKSSIIGIGFNSSSTRLVSISKDGNWKVWDISMDHRIQETVLLKSGHIPITIKQHSSLANQMYACISGSGDCLVITFMRSMWFIDVDNEQIIEEIHNLPSPVRQLQYEVKNHLFFCNASRHILVFNDAVSELVNLRRLKTKLKVIVSKSKSGDNSQDAKQLKLQISNTEAQLKDWKCTMAE